jgi:hypothetical protein
MKHLIRVGHYSGTCGELVHVLLNGGALGNPSNFERFNFVDKFEQRRLEREYRVNLEEKFRRYRNEPKR